MSRRPSPPINPLRRLLALSPSLLALRPGAAAAATAGGPVALWDAHLLVLDNGAARRVLALPSAARPYLTTIDFRTAQAPSRYATGVKGDQRLESEEVSFRLNGRRYGSASGWTLAGIETLEAELQGSGARVTLLSRDGLAEVALEYLMYPGLPLVRKRLAIRHRGRRRARLESLMLEHFALEDYWAPTFSWVISDYGRRKSLVPFTGTRQDALVALHQPDHGEGIVLGNEAPGVLKFTSVCDGGPYFRTGLAPHDSAYPFRRWLAPGEQFVSPHSFAIVYAGAPRFDDVLNSVVPDFVRRHMGIRLARNSYRPTFLYNTWEPFQTSIDERLVMELADAAAALGVKEFIIDDGWQDCYGDWGVARIKFPRGLRPVMEHIKSLGMKPGLWVSVGSAGRASRVYRAHPEWFVRDRAGHHTSLHMPDGAPDTLTACFSTGWRQYIENVLNRLTREHGLEYLKLDFAVVTSPYVFKTEISGCYASDHPGHLDQPESLYQNYEAMWSLFDRFHASFPEVFIDCTFEAMGGIQLVDYAMLRHAEGNWLSNFDQPGSAGDLRIRNMAWWRAPAMPATALVIGNAQLGDPGVEQHLQALGGALPILLGDPRTLAPATRAMVRSYAGFFAALQARHAMFDYRQDLPNFGEPREGGWDGYQRINTSTGSGGLVGVFRHGAAESERRVTLRALEPGRQYALLAMDGNEVLRALGAELMATGFACRLERRYDGRLYELRRL